MFEFPDYPASEGDVVEICLVIETSGILSQPVDVMIMDLGGSATGNNACTFICVNC